MTDVFCVKLDVKPCSINRGGTGAIATPTSIIRRQSMYNAPQRISVQILRKYPAICQNSYYFCSQISYTALAFGCIFLATTNVVVPVFKKGVSGSVQNYRPISITCVVSKIMERIVSDRITNHLLQIIFCTVLKTCF